ncbi:MAG: aminotransferase class I/II-fold pyridoxal phosphate-dependent enzyme [bacterium]
MFQALKPISISLSPNTEKDDVFLAFKLIFQPWRWIIEVEGEEDKSSSSPFAAAREGEEDKSSSSPFAAAREIEGEFKKYLGVKYAISFNSGRSALMAILQALQEGDLAFSEASAGKEVLLQAFTCNAAVNPVFWAGLKTVYVDCDEKTFNIDVEDLKRKITSNSRIVVVQHTFGLPANLDEVLRICRENNLILVEDCAHSLGAEYKGKKVGAFGKAAFFSFSRDKVISSVYGGMAVTNDDVLAQKMREYQEKIGYPSFCWILQQLIHPVLMNWLILPTYRVFGKYLLVLFQWLHILSKAVHWKEKRGRKPDYFPKRLPNALAVLAFNQFKKLERFNRHRREIADFYAQELANTKYKIPDTMYKEGNIFLRFTLKHREAREIIKKAWRRNLLIGDWYTTPIAPHDTKLEKLGYQLGVCPKAEKLSKETFNLPTHINISEKEAQKIIDFLLKWK